MVSLDSANGPSVTVIFPPEEVTRVPSASSPPAASSTPFLVISSTSRSISATSLSSGGSALEVVIRNRIVVSLASLGPGPAGPPADASNRGRRNRHPRQDFSQRAMRRMSRPGRLPRPAGECATMGAASTEEAGMTKFMLLQNYGATLACDLPMTEWDPADIKAHIEFQMALNDELAGNGELVDAQGLAGPELAKFVTFDGVGAPV